MLADVADDHSLNLLVVEQGAPQGVPWVSAPDALRRARVARSRDHHLTLGKMALLDRWGVDGLTADLVNDKANRDSKMWGSGRLLRAAVALHHDEALDALRGARACATSWSNVSMTSDQSLSRACQVVISISRLSQWQSPSRVLGRGFSRSFQPC